MQALRGPSGPAQSTAKVDMSAMNIGQAAQVSGLSAKMIRHYEALGLLVAPARTEAGYRQYGAADVHALRFIRQARDLGFSLHDIGELLSLWHDRQRPSRMVKALAEAHIVALEQKAQELMAMKNTLQHLVQGCHGDERPDCPILDTLAGLPTEGDACCDGPAVPAHA
jgi:Cu(I)-responsive transcriptional regulator